PARSASRHLVRFGRGTPRLPDNIPEANAGTPSDTKTAARERVLRTPNGGSRGSPGQPRFPEPFQCLGFTIRPTGPPAKGKRGRRGKLGMYLFSVGVVRPSQCGSRSKCCVLSDRSAGAVDRDVVGCRATVTADGTAT